MLLRRRYHAVRTFSPTASRAGTRLYYGWVMLVALAAGQVTSWGILYYSFAVFLAPMHDDLGWSVTQITGAYSLGLLISGLAAIPFGRWLDRHGPRVLMTAGSILATLLVVAWATVDSLLGFYLIWSAIGVIMAAIFYEPTFVIVANWFDRFRSRALTVLTFVGGFASVIYLPLSSWLVHAYGWRTALLVLAAILAAGTIPIHALMVRQYPRDLGLLSDGGPGQTTATTAGVTSTSVTRHDALHDSVFWWIAGGFVLATMTSMGVVIHLIPHLVNQGYSPGFAASATGAIGALGLPGRLIFTPLGSKIERRWVIASIFGLQAAALLVLLLVQSTVGVMLFVVLFGAGFGAMTPARAALVAELYGPAHYGSISGVLALFTTGSRAIAPVGAGVLYTALNSYTPVFWLLAAFSGLASLAALRAKATPRQRPEVTDRIETPA